MPEKIDGEKASKWLNDKTANEVIQCPVCKSRNWSLSNNVVEIREFERNALGGNVYPIFTLTCMVCGYTLLFNAIIAGLVKPEGPATEQTQVQPAQPAVQSSQEGQPH